MERIRPPQELTESVDFTVDQMCEGCPLRRPKLEGFLPAYGVILVPEPATTQLQVVNFEAQWNMNRHNSEALQDPIQVVELKVGGLLIVDAMQAFKESQGTVTIPRRFRPDKTVCSALDTVLGNEAPTRENLKIHAVR